MDGAFLINKHAGISSFGVIEVLKNIAVKKLAAQNSEDPARLRWHDLPQELQKMGHGGTLDPFATGLLLVCAGRAVKLSRYFLGSVKSYTATLHFGETTVPGDPTAEISERSEKIPESLKQLQSHAEIFASRAYQQIPPMHSAKKKNGKPLYELARQGIEIERDPKLCQLSNFNFSEYRSPDASFSVICSAGTYIRTLAQDFAKELGTFGMLNTLHRTASGCFSVQNALTTDRIEEALINEGKCWEELPCFVPFDRLLNGYPRSDATEQEALELSQGRQNVLHSILSRAQQPESSQAYSDSAGVLTIYFSNKLFAVARRNSEIWELERVFPSQSPK